MKKEATTMVAKNNTTGKNTTKGQMKEYPLQIAGELCLRNSIFSKEIGRKINLLGRTKREFPDQFIEWEHYIDTTIGQLKEENDPTKVGRGSDNLTITLVTYDGIKMLDELYRGKYHDIIVPIVKRFYRDQYNVDQYFEKDRISESVKQISKATVISDFSKGKITMAEASRLLQTTPYKFKKLVNEYNETKFNTLPKREENGKVELVKAEEVIPAPVAEERSSITDNNQLHLHEDLVALTKEVSEMNKNIKELLKIATSMIAGTRVVSGDPSGTHEFSEYKQDVSALVTSLVDNPSSKFYTSNSVLTTAYAKIEDELGVDWNEYTQRFVSRTRKQPKNMMVLSYWVEKNFQKDGMLMNTLIKMGNEIEEVRR